METFSPRLEVLPAPQRRLWSELGDVPSEFVLYGGTAVALQLGHRSSDDFDFFARTELDPRLLYERLAMLKGSHITQLEPNTLTCVLERDGSVKVSFFGLPALRRIHPPLTAPDNGLSVASLHDLAGTKMQVVQQRAEAKDYQDIDALVQIGRLDLPTQLAAGRAVFGDSFQPLPSLKALVYYAEGDLERLPKDVRERLTAAVIAVDPLKLPSIQPLPD